MTEFLSTPVHHYCGQVETDSDRLAQRVQNTDPRETIYMACFLLCDLFINLKLLIQLICLIWLSNTKH